MELQEIKKRISEIKKAEKAYEKSKKLEVVTFNTWGEFKKIVAGERKKIGQMTFRRNIYLYRYIANKKYKTDYSDTNYIRFNNYIALLIPILANYNQEEFDKMATNKMEEIEGAKCDFNIEFLDFI